MILTTLCLTVATLHAPAPSASPIDLAICLDTSNSMDGLIDAARLKLWEIVNDLALAEPTPELRVALLSYGNNGYDASTGWVVVDTPLTSDLDLVSQKLFGLTTNGGDEYVGRVTARATDQLDWHPSTDALKLIIVAGNESAAQDPEITVADACRGAISQGIMINAIYCGNPADQLAPGWQQVAKLADGQFASIDQQNGTVVITTPFDERLAEISAAVNLTYVPYGAAGETAWANQTAQDENASNMSSAAAAQRCSTKAGALYNNSHWDLVDACTKQTVKLEDVKVEDLPEVMQAMTMDERQAYLDGKITERKALQKEATELTTKREVFVRKEMERQAVDSSKSFGRVVRDAVRAQASAKGFTFPEDPAPVADADEESEPQADSQNGEPGC